MEGWRREKRGEVDTVWGGRQTRVRESDWSETEGEGGYRGLKQGKVTRE